jgi:hypothetical protein
MDWTRAGRSKSCLNQKDLQRAKSTLMRKPKQEQIQRGNFAFWRNVFDNHDKLMAAISRRVGS